jgi:hypothetical protein
MTNGYFNNELLLIETYWLNLKKSENSCEPLVIKIV